MSKKIKVRNPGFTFPDTISKYWLDGSIFKTSLLNSFTLEFPSAEKLFGRSAKKHLPGKDKPELRQAALAFIGQETQHSKQHLQFWKNLQNQGYDLKPFANFLDHTIEFFESRLTDGQVLATITGFEHYTALLAELAIKNDLLAGAEPSMKELFEWHIMEELEHKAVAFDLLQENYPDYTLRIGGMLFATALLVSFTSVGTLSLIIQDKKLFDLSVWKHAFDYLFFKDKLFFEAFEMFLEYFDKNFHPNNRDDSHLLEKIAYRKKEIA
ncbi:MAG: metal-dependent hydrolase [Spirochaetota bacterium]